MNDLELSFPATPPMWIDMLASSYDQQKHRLAAGALLSRVLVVDDDKHFRDLARGILEPEGFLVIEAENVGECLSMLGDHRVDVILLDIVMPERDGIEAVQEIKRVHPTKIVTVSGARNSEVYLAASAYLGADASLGKSEIRSLCALLELLLDSKS